MYRIARVNYDGQLAGILSETKTGYQFAYDSQHLQRGHAISISLPLRAAPYKSKDLFSFFEGLLPEGWYLEVVSAIAKVDTKDSFGLLLATASDTIGAVTIQEG
jgi:serine/threonine-protein kinase HipA